MIFRTFLFAFCKPYRRNYAAKLDSCVILAPAAGAVDAYRNRLYH